MSGRKSFYVRIFDHEERGPTLVDTLTLDCEATCLEAARNLARPGTSTLAFTIEEHEDATETMRVLGRFPQGPQNSA